MFKQISKDIYSKFLKTPEWVRQIAFIVCLLVGMYLTIGFIYLVGSIVLYPFFKLAAYFVL